MPDWIKAAFRWLAGNRASFDSLAQNWERFSDKVNERFDDALARIAHVEAELAECRRECLRRDKQIADMNAKILALQKKKK